MHKSLDTPTPLGCFIGFLGLVAGGLAALYFWGAYKALTKEPPLTELGHEMIKWGIAPLVLAILGIAYSIYRFRTSSKRYPWKIGNILSS